MLSLLIVNYRSASLAVHAIRTAREGTRSPLRVVVVDNSCDEGEGELLRPHADVFVASRTNRGYAGAINDGRGYCDGEVMVASNADVTFAPGALDLLAGEIRGDVAAAGPSLYWDSAWQWVLPPADLHTAGEKIDQVLATRWAVWMRNRDRRRIRRRVRFWSRRETFAVPVISGAVMALSVRHFDALDGFDERFPLYFEETDYFRRAAVRGNRIVYVPAARCRHVYDQSASQDRAHASAAYAQSELRYLAKWNGPWLAQTLKRFERAPRSIDAKGLRGPLEIAREGLLVELSPSPDFNTAAGCRPAPGTVDLPDDAWQSFQGDALYLRVVEPASARVVATFVRYKD